MKTINTNMTDVRTPLFEQAACLSLRLLILSLVPALVQCANSSSSASGGGNGSASTSDTSPSVVSAEAVGGALTTANGAGTQASYKFNLPGRTVGSAIMHLLSPLPQAQAGGGLCPTFQSTGAASGCSTSGASMWLNYQDCSFTGIVSWSGVQELRMSAGTANCGTFPNPGANGTLYRQFVSVAGAGSPGSLSLTARARTATVDDASTNLANFDGDTIQTFNPNGGYGTAVSFNASGGRSSITVGHHITVTGRYDHSLSGTLSVTETAGATSRTVNGSVKLYHNLLKVIATSTFNSVMHSDVCCLPVGGTVTTQYSAGTNASPTHAGEALVGKSETLTFTGCGTATLQTADGSVANITLDRCF